MSASAMAVLEVVNAGLAVVRLFREMGLDINHLIAVQELARKEGRELLPEELAALSLGAHEAGDRLDSRLRQPQ